VKARQQVRFAIKSADMDDRLGRNPEGKGIHILGRKSLFDKTKLFYELCGSDMGGGLKS